MVQVKGPASFFCLWISQHHMLKRQLFSPLNYFSTLVKINLYIYSYANTTLSDYYSFVVSSVVEK